MGREVRRVPATWKHPKDCRGHHVPLHGGSFSQRAKEWDEEEAQWVDGFKKNWGAGEKWIPRHEDQNYDFEEWAGKRPVESDYMPDWPESERTHLQMYECTTEGTPISPVMATAEELARWLADNGASAFGDLTATYEQWLATITSASGYAPSGMMVVGGPMVSGVEGLAEIKNGQSRVVPNVIGDEK